MGAERQGVARILEALEANMWPGLCMKPQYQTSGKASDRPPRIATGSDSSHSGKGADVGEEMRSATRGIDETESTAAGAPLEGAAVQGDVSSSEFLRGPEILAFRELLEAESGKLGTDKQISEEEVETEKLAQMMDSFAGEGCRYYLRCRVQLIDDVPGCSAGTI